MTRVTKIHKREDDPLESLELIRQSIREVCIQNQSTWEQSWRSVPADIHQERRGLLAPDVFQQTLELNDVRLSKPALRALVDHFQLANGTVQTHKFLQWINLSRPVDHIDPELAFARLPQPYRRISKVLEHAILDAAWEIITATSTLFKTETAVVVQSPRPASSSEAPPSDDVAVDGEADGADRAKKRSSELLVFRELPTSGEESESVVRWPMHPAIGWQSDDDPTKSLELIRQSIRQICVQDQFTWEQSWKSVLSDVNQVRRGLLLPDVFQQTLEMNDVRLTKPALRGLVTQFQLANGAVQAHKFLQWIDLSRPEDHIDPELAFARLPQPYRRIGKVLEHTILDAAWETITATSAVFKAEAAAALSARSARSSGLLQTSGGDTDAALGGGLDDYDRAKKRCCKTSRELPTPVDGLGSVVMMRKHWKMPFLVAVWRSDDANAAAEDHVKIQLVDTQSRTALAVVPVAVSRPDGVASTGSMIHVLEASQLHCRASESNANASVLVVALHVRTLPVPQEQSEASPLPPSPSSSVLVYEFTVPSVETMKSPSPSGRLLTSIVIDDDGGGSSSSPVTALDISNDASLLAISTAKRETHVYTLHSSTQEPQVEAAETAESTLPPPQLLTTLTTEASATAVYFLATPATDLKHQHPTTAPYAIALVSGTMLSKFLLPVPETSTTSTPGSLHASWRHLSSISCSSIDPTSQFLTLGLVDGLVVVWNVLEDRDHVMISPALTKTRATAIDQVVLYDDHYLVVLSLGAQQLSFFDISHRAAPSLIRVVTPPPPPPSPPQAKDGAPAINPPRFVALSSQSAWLDVPIVLVEYSNGYAMLYDMRCGEAVASIRTPKQQPLSPDTHVLQSTVLGLDGVVAIAPAASTSSSPSSLVVFEWAELLKVALPSLQLSGVEKTAANLKSAFVADTADCHAGLTLSLGAKSSLHSLLVASAGRHSGSTSGTHQLQNLVGTGSKSTSTLTTSSSNSDSRTSLKTATTGGLEPPAAQLPALRELLTYPLTPSFSAQFDQYCEEENVLVPRGDRDSKLQRRRNELIKILTAAW